jgi:hypothetical protein
MRTDLARGVTATVGAAKVYRGAPHIHNKSWWDDEVLYPALFKGATMGEALLLNQVHLGWIATFVGDPLYRMPAVQRMDNTTPRFDPRRDVRTWIARNEQGDKEVWLSVDLGSSPAAPETAQLRAIAPGGAVAICPTFEARPSARLGSTKDACGVTWQIELLDPFGNRSSTAVQVKC